MDNMEDTIEQLRKQQEEMLKEYGYVIHYVPDDGFINCHTHGLSESHNHMDLQIVLPLGQETAFGVIHNVVRLITGGKLYAGHILTPKKIIQDGDIITEKIIQPGFPIKFVRVSEGDRYVLRLLFCDEDKRLPCEKGCDQQYVKQLFVNTGSSAKNSAMHGCSFQRGMEN